ncbi:MAG: PAS domain-containing protein [Methanomicrobiales archaeon]|nr:PAS domain-containing protein [Methanomicrobiales archaeon]
MLLDYASEFIIVLDTRMKILKVNESLLQFFGMEREAVEGKYITEVPVALFRALNRSDVLRSPLQKITAEIEYIDADQTHYFRVRCLPTRFDDADEGYTLLIENISEQKNYEQQLLQSEARYRAVVEDQNDFICRRMPDGTITFVNTEFLRFFKKKSHEIIGSKYFPRQAAPSAIPESQSSDILLYQCDIFEQCVMLENGDIRWIQWKNKLLTDPSGTLSEIQSVGRDITPLREREKEILIKKCSIDASTQALVIFDIVARIIYANGSFLRMFGCHDETDAVGRCLEQFIARHDPGSNIRQLTCSLQQTGRFDGIAKASKMDGSIFDAEIHIAVIKNDPNFPFHGIALLIDRSECPAAVKEILVNNFQQPQALKGMIFMDPSGRTLHVNRVFLTISGHNDELHLVGNPADTYIGIDIADLTGSPGEADDAPEESGRTCDGTIRCRNGTVIPVTFSVRDIKDPDGILLGSEITFEIPSSHLDPERMEQSFEIIPVPTFAIDLEKKVFLWNRAMESFTGISRENVIGTSGYRDALLPFHGVQHPLIDIVNEPLDTMRRIYPGINKYGDTIILDWFVPGCTPDKGMYFHERACAMLDSAGNTIGYAESILDITEWKRSMEYMNAMKNEIEACLQSRIMLLQEPRGSLAEQPIKNVRPE